MAMLGFILGAGIGGAQIYVFEKPKYIASVVLNERVFFDEYWASAPDILVKAELKRVEFANRDRNNAQNADVVLEDLLNEWFRLLDDTLFRFPIDEALKSNAIGREVKRYAEVQRGIIDGLNQRSIVFRIVGPEKDRAKKALVDWVAAVQNNSEALATEAIKSWLRRKAMSLEVLAENGGFDLSGSELKRIGNMAVSFRRAADEFLVISPYQDILSEVSVVKQPQQNAVRVLIWALAGALLSIVVAASVRAKKA